MIIMLFILSLKAFSAVPSYWNYIIDIENKHEFYQSNEAITKPSNSWQVLFSLVYLDTNFQRNKDCIIFRVPGVEEGVLKIKAIPADENCDKYLLSAADKEIKDIKNLVFNFKKNKLKINLTFSDFKTEVLEIRLQGQFKRPAPKLNLSSSEFKSPKVILLAMTNSQAAGILEMKDGTLCHNVNDDCEVKSPPSCSQCKNGFFEIQNGCFVAPKYCGQKQCGIKGNQACRKGFRWQREDQETYDCRVDSSFAYCSLGLSIQCEGKKAYCR